MKKLIKLILESRSMETDVIRQERIKLLEFMQPEHIERLTDILTREKKALKKIQDKYDRKKKEAIKKTIKDNNLSSLMAI